MGSLASFSYPKIPNSVTKQEVTNQRPWETGVPVELESHTPVSSVFPTTS